MSSTTHDIQVDSFVPESCTLPTAEQPIRVAEFENFFVSSVRVVHRHSPTRVDFILDGDRQTQTTARELAARETDCCSFFTFSFRPARQDPDGSEGAGLVMSVEVPENRADVLDGFRHLAESALSGHGSN